MARTLNVVTADTLKLGGGFVGDLLNVAKPQPFTFRQALTKSALEVYGQEAMTDKKLAVIINEPEKYKRFAIYTDESFYKYHRHKVYNPFKLAEFAWVLLANEVDVLSNIDRLGSDDKTSYFWRVPFRFATRFLFGSIVGVTKLFTSPVNSIYRPMRWFVKEHPYIATALLLFTIAVVVTLALSTAGVGALAPLVPAIPFLLPLIGKSSAFLVTNIMLSLLIPAVVKLWKGFSDEMRINGKKCFTDHDLSHYADGRSDVTSVSQRHLNTPAYKIVRSKGLAALMKTEGVLPVKGRLPRCPFGKMLFGPNIRYTVKKSEFDALANQYHLKILPSADDKISWPAEGQKFNDDDLNKSIRGVRFQKSPEEAEPICFDFKFVGGRYTPYTTLAAFLGENANKPIEQVVDALKNSRDFVDGIERKLDPDAWNPPCHRLLPAPSQ